MPDIQAGFKQPLPEGFARPTLAYDLLSVAMWVTNVCVILMLMTCGRGGLLAGAALAA